LQLSPFFAKIIQKKAEIKIEKEEILEELMI